MDLPFKLPPDLQNILHTGLKRIESIRGAFDPTALKKPSVSNVPPPQSAPPPLAPWQGIFGSPDVPGRVVVQPVPQQGPGALGWGALAMSLGAFWLVIRNVNGKRPHDPLDPSAWTNTRSLRRRSRR